MTKQPAFDLDELEDMDSVHDERASEALFLKGEDLSLSHFLDLVLAGCGAGSPGGKGFSGGNTCGGSKGGGFKSGGSSKPKPKNTVSKNYDPEKAEEALKAERGKTRAKGFEESLASGENMDRARADGQDAVDTPKPTFNGKPPEQLIAQLQESGDPAVAKDVLTNTELGIGEILAMDDEEALNMAQAVIERSSAESPITEQVGHSLRLPSIDPNDPARKLARPKDDFDPERAVSRFEEEVADQPRDASGKPIAEGTEDFGFPTETRRGIPTSLPQDEEEIAEGMRTSKGSVNEQLERQLKQVARSKEPKFKSGDEFDSAMQNFRSASEGDGDFDPNTDFERGFEPTPDQTAIRQEQLQRNSSLIDQEIARRQQGIQSRDVDERGNVDPAAALRVQDGFDQRVKDTSGFTESLARDQNPDRRQRATEQEELNQQGFRPETPLEIAQATRPSQAPSQSPTEVEAPPVSPKAIALRKEREQQAEDDEKSGATAQREAEAKQRNEQQQSEQADRRGARAVSRAFDSVLGTSRMGAGGGALGALSGVTGKREKAEQKKAQDITREQNKEANLIRRQLKSQGIEVPNLSDAALLERYS